MIAKKKASKKKNIIIGSVAGASILLAGFFLYITFFSEPDIDLGELNAGAFGGGSIQTNFQTELLDDPRVESLRQYGTSEVQVQFRGRKVDPFLPF
jgi:hypothetical protein